ncbi:stress response protein NST1 isoform X2 [Acipenser oxyrinchus oxyrinchus]|uniref:Stress response protein NST1 isoform X2 n=1 Tax=Acipenser oxyrinchus oxyrinchus TaxID=40147 RepID=A0AAD8D9Q5_ACIOX|nr:stress response protein NST1 isoform X2 [Acipenser oxyrinchus oxyrinchus]
MVQGGRVVILSSLPASLPQPQMNWDTQLSSILSTTDSSMARIRERLNTAGSFSKDELGDSLHMKSLLYQEPSPSPSYLEPLPPRMERGDLTGVHTQLQSQSRAIESLTQTVLRLEKDWELQQHCIQTLEEEVHRLRSRGEEEQRRSPERQLERRVEEWKRGVTSELYSLRAQLQREAERAGSQGQQEIQDSKKLLREECETLRREVEHIKLQLRRQEEELLNKIFETREMKRSQERNSKTLEGLTHGYRSHSVDLNKVLSSHHYTEQEFKHIRSSVMDLKEEVRSLKQSVGRLDQSSTLTARTGLSSSRVQGSHRTRRAGEPHPEQLDRDSDLELSPSPSPSLGDISSDDLSSLPDLHSRARRTAESKYATGVSSELEGSDIGETESDLEDDSDVASFAVHPDKLSPVNLTCDL